MSCGRVVIIATSHDEITLSCVKKHELMDHSVVVLEESPCPCPWTTKSSKIVKYFTFCKQSVMITIWSINSVTVTVHEVTVKNGLLADVRYYLLIRPNISQ